MTGGNAGVGYATAEALLQHGCHVVLACRDRGRGDAAASRLAAPGRVQVELLDLASLASVK